MILLYVQVTLYIYTFMLRRVTSCKPLMPPPRIALRTSHHSVVLPPKTSTLAEHVQNTDSSHLDSSEPLSLPKPCQKQLHILC